jgi:DNA processing protein
MEIEATPEKAEISKITENSAPTAESTPDSEGISRTRLAWATLAYIADGPDPLLMFLARHVNPVKLLGLLRGLATEGTLVRDWQNTEPLREFEKLLHSLSKKCNDYRSLNNYRDFRRTFFLPVRPDSRFKKWLTRLGTLDELDSPKLTATLTCEGRYSLVTPLDAEWPEVFDDLLLRTDSTPPFCLWVDGDASILKQLDGSVSIVGSREANDYGQRCAHDIATRVASKGLVVVSGGAMGIDAHAHWAAVSNNSIIDNGLERFTSAPTALTIAVFAGGLHHIGPSRNLRLFDEIISHGGALISELPPDSVPHSGRFLERNRLIAALSSCVVVAQAKYRSGAINTAQWANELGRSVLAIPGNIDSPMNAGCNRLIAEQKASILTQVTDIDVFLPHELQEEDVRGFSGYSLPLSSGYSDAQDLILREIRKAKGHGIDRHDLIAALEQKLTTEQVQSSVGLMELTGEISVSDNGHITL